MLRNLQTIWSIDDLADVLEIATVHSSWIEAERMNTREAADAERNAANRIRGT